jgi:hypothetical protein
VSKLPVNVGGIEEFRAPKKIKDFDGALKFLCYSLPLSKGLSNLPVSE